MDNIEKYHNQAAFASLREPAWHGLGTVFQNPVSTQEMLDLSHLSDWNLQSIPLKTDESWIQDYNKIVRMNPFTKKPEVLGVVSPDYTIFSNEDLFALGDSLIDKRIWETAGSIRGGRTVFATMTEDDDIILDPGGQADRIKKYLLLTSSHDGKGNTRAKKTNIRVVCQNTLNVALSSVGSEISVRHTKNMRDRILEANRILRYTIDYDQEFEKLAQEMIQKKISDQVFWDIVKDVYPAPAVDKKGSRKKYDNDLALIESIWNNETGSVGNLDNTSWKAFNVLTERQQWFRRIKNGASDSVLIAGSGFDQAANTSRQRILSRTLGV